MPTVNVNTQASLCYYAPLIRSWQVAYMNEGSNTFNDKKFQDFSRTVKTFFQDNLGAHQHLDIKTNSSYLLYIIIVFK